VDVKHGPVTVGRFWRKRSNQKLKELYKGPYLVTVIKKRRLEWWGM
jgi:hypothetical protein